MNKLYFFRARSHNSGQVVFLLTAENPESAKQLGLSMINPDYVAEFKDDAQAEFVCFTPDVILSFEPV